MEEKSNLKQDNRFLAVHFPSEEIRCPRLIESVAEGVPRRADNLFIRGEPTEAGNPEYARLLGALDWNQWRRQETAKALRLSRTTLWRKMREFKLA